MKTKIRTITEKTYQGKVTGHVILFENGVEGYLNDKESDSELKAGEDVDYELVVKKNKQGKDYNLLSIKRSVSETTQKEVKTETKPPQKTEIPLSTRLERPNTKSFIEMKHELRRDLIETLGRIAAAGRIEPKEMVDYYNEYYPALDLSIDVLNK